MAGFAMNFLKWSNRQIRGVVEGRPEAPITPPELPKPIDNAAEADATAQAASKARLQQRKRAKGMQGRQSTLLTEGLGAAPVERKTLLGL